MADTAINLDETQATSAPVIQKTAFGGLTAMNKAMRSDATPLTQLQHMLALSEQVYDKKKTNFLDRLLAKVFNQGTDELQDKINSRWAEYAKVHGHSINNQEHKKAFIKDRAHEFVNEIKENKQGNMQSYAYAGLGTFSAFSSYLKGEQGLMSTLSEATGSGISALFGGQFSNMLVKQFKNLSTKHPKLRFLSSPLMRTGLGIFGWQILSGMWDMTAGSIFNRIDGPEIYARRQQQMGGLAPGMPSANQYGGMGLAA